MKRRVQCLSFIGWLHLFRMRGLILNRLRMLRLDRLMELSLYVLMMLATALRITWWEVWLSPMLRIWMLLYCSMNLLSCLMMHASLRWYIVELTWLAFELLTWFFIQILWLYVCTHLRIVKLSITHSRLAMMLFWGSCSLMAPKFGLLLSIVFTFMLAWSHLMVTFLERWLIYFLWLMLDNLRLLRIAWV